jgi:hypothetical protein
MASDENEIEARIKAEDQESLFNGIIESFNKGFMGGEKSYFDGLKAVAYKEASDLLKEQQNLIGVLGKGNDTFINMTTGVNEIQEKFWSMQTAGGTALNTIFNDQAEVIGEYQEIINSNLLKIHATSKTVTAREMADLALYGKALNFNASQTQKFLERQFALTGEANDDLLKQTLAYSDAIEDSTGISSKIIAGNISGMMSDVKTFGNMTVEEMSEAAAAIAKVGLEVSDVAGLVGKFSTFEGAAESVSKLTQVFGVQMDTMKYMTASFESPEEMLAMIQEDFETAGVDMANMNMAQKRLLSQTLGMDISSVEQLLGDAGSDLSQFTSQVSGATAGVGESELQNALAQADGDIKRINHMYGSVEEAARHAGERTAKAIGSVFSTELASIGTEAQALLGTGIAISSGISLKGKTILSEAIGLNEIGVAISAVTTNINEEGEALLAALNNTDKLTGYVETRSVPIETSSAGSASGGQSSPAIPVLESTDRKAISEGIASTQEGSLAVVSVNENASVEQLRALVNEVNEASGNKFDGKIENMVRSLLIEQEKLNKNKKENQTINITITDTGPGFEWKADKAGVAIVSN